MADKSTKFGVQPRLDLSIDFSLGALLTFFDFRLKSIDRSERGSMPNLVLLSAMLSHLTNSTMLYNSQ